MSVTILRLGPEGSPRVTLIPGFMGGPRSFEALAFHLPDDVGVRVVTLPGHGDRPEIPESGAWDAIVAGVAREVGAGARAPREVLVGYSMGGRVALDLATRDADRYAAVVAVSADLGLADDDARARRVAEDEARAARLEAEGLPAFVDGWQALPLFASQRALSERVLDAQRRMRLANTTAGLAWALRHLGTGRMPDLRARLEASSTPITFAAGGLDPKFCALAEEGARVASRGAWAAFHGVGHNVPLEAPRKLARLVVDRACVASNVQKKRDNESISSVNNGHRTRSES